MENTNKEKKNTDKLHNIVGVDTSIGKGQYLAFFMNNEEYAIDILSVMEIRGWESPTPLPSSVHFIKGVINLRGNIIPVIDLRERFNLHAKEYNEMTVVIVLQVQIDDRTRHMGIIVDAVSEVYNVSEENIKKIPDVMASLDSTFIKGLADIDDKMVILINVENLINNNLETDIKKTLEKFNEEKNNLELSTDETEVK